LLYKHLNVPAKKASRKSSPKKPTEKITTVLPSGRKDSSFFEQVYDVARQIPRGRVTSYGAIAAYLGTKLSARMVGWAMNGSFHAKPSVPAHRVVNRMGMLSGKMHFSTPTRMEELLKKEKILVKDDQVVDFEKKFWDPAVELEI
jgi:methylated-DNA-protein-cysteine methyltransferase-like protein